MLHLKDFSIQLKYDISDIKRLLDPKFSNLQKQNKKNNYYF